MRSFSLERPELLSEAPCEFVSGEAWKLLKRHAEFFWSGMRSFTEIRAQQKLCMLYPGFFWLRRSFCTHAPREAEDKPSRLPRYVFTSPFSIVGAVKKKKYI